jgi:hypothetical protein
MFFSCTQPCGSGLPSEHEDIPKTEGMQEDASWLFLLNLDTWVTQESLLWLIASQTPVFVVNDVSGGKFKEDLFDSTGRSRLNLISEEVAVAMLLASCKHEDGEEEPMKGSHGITKRVPLKLMTNGEAAYGWLRNNFGAKNDKRGAHLLPSLRMMQVCSDKHEFRAVTQAAFPELKTLSFTADSDDAHMQNIVAEMRRDGTEWILKPSMGFCAVGVTHWGGFDGGRAADAEEKFSVLGLRKAFGDVFEEDEGEDDAVRQNSGLSADSVPEHDPKTAAAPGDSRQLLVETFLRGHQYTADGYFDDAGEVRVLTVSWAPKDPRNPADIREVVLGTDLRILREQRPLAEEMMMKIQQAATERTFDRAGEGTSDAVSPDARQRHKFFRNFPFMVEYRVDPLSGKALPIEVNALRHEGKSPAYCSLIYNIPLYDFFFKGLVFTEDLLKEDMFAVKSSSTESNGAGPLPGCSQDGVFRVAAMAFARKPEVGFHADHMDYKSWAAIMQSLDGDASPQRPLSRRCCSRFENGDNYFFGWARGYFAGWDGLLSVLEPEWERQFVRNFSRTRSNLRSAGAPGAMTATFSEIVARL